MRTSWLWCLVCVVLVASIACGVGSKSPGEVVEAAYMAANDGLYSEVEEYLSSDVLELSSRMGGMKSEWDRLTRNGTIERIEILKEEVRGEGADVDFRIHFEGGATRDEDEPLLKEDGKWDITVG